MIIDEGSEFFSLIIISFAESKVLFVPAKTPYFDNMPVVVRVVVPGLAEIGNIVYMEVVLLHSEIVNSACYSVVEEFVAFEEENHFYC